MSKENLGKKKKNVDTLAYRREQLRYWPYTIYQIDETLDISLIEGKAKQLLFQALNSRTLRVFAGSGLSASYGRLSWSDWKKEQLRVVKESAREFLDVADASIEWMNWLLRALEPPENKENEATDGASEDATDGEKDADSLLCDDLKQLLLSGDDSGSEPEGLSGKHRRNLSGWLKARRDTAESAQEEIQRLLDILTRATNPEGTFPGGEALPVEFEIAQKLHDQLQKYVGLYSEEDDDKQDLLAAFQDRYWSGTLHDPDSAVPKDSLAQLRDVLKTKASEELRWLVSVPAARWTSAKTARKYFEKWRAYCMMGRRRPTQVSFETLAKFLLVDECAHAAHLLRRGLQGTQKREAVNRLEATFNIFDPGKLKRNLDGIREAPEQYVALTAFTFDAMQRVQDKLKLQPAYDRWNATSDRLKERLSDYSETASDGGDERRYLTPTSRFLVPALLRLFKEPFETFKANAFDHQTSQDAGFNLVHTPDRSDFSSRRSIIADRFDPLAKIIRRLDVTNFITTNYDFEIERFFADSGFSRFGPSTLAAGDARTLESDDDFRSDHLGATLKDRTFKRERAAELVNFSVGKERVGANVFHLHGRATRDDGLVISERNYLDLYLSEDGDRETVDEAIGLAFSSSPVLFVGLGMTETDMLRPLRQFISNRDRTMGYNAITLLPAEKGYAARVKTASALYLRYGVHTIFYGSGFVKRRSQNGAEAKDDVEVGIDWLYRILTVVGTMTAKTEHFLKLAKKDKCDDVIAETRKRKWAASAIGEIYDALGTIGDDLASDGILSKDESAFNVIAGLTGKYEPKDTDDIASRDEQIQTLRAHLTRKCGAMETSLFRMPYFTPVRPDRRKDGPDHTSGLVTIYGKPYVGFYVQLLEDLLRMFIRPFPKGMDKAALIRDLEARQIMFDGLWAAFIGTSMNAALDSIEEEWRDWWTDWQDPPEKRIPAFEKFHYPEPVTQCGDQDFIAPSRRIRHRVVSVITDLTKAEASTCADAVTLEPAHEGGPDFARLVPELRTYVRSFDTFIAALAAENHRNPVCFRTAGRRCYVVAALRGQGKGTFMNVMTTRLGLSLYGRAAWPENGIRTTADPSLGDPSDFRIGFVSAIFINYSFSSEIASTFDMVIEAVRDATRRLTALLQIKNSRKGRKAARATDLGYLEAVAFCDEQDDISKATAAQRKLIGEWRDAYDMLVTERHDEADRSSRVGNMRRAFDQFKDASKEYAKSPFVSGRRIVIPRLFICINAADLLFWPDGQAKNREIDDFIHLLVGDHTKDMPIDLVVIGSEDGLGFPWKVDRDAPDPTETEDRKKGLKLKRLDRYGLPHAASEHIARRMSATTIDVRDETTSDPTDGFIHFARPLSPIQMMISNFSLLAKVLFLFSSDAGKDYLAETSGDQSETHLEALVGKARLAELEDEKRSALRTLSEVVVSTRARTKSARGKLWAKQDVPTPEKIDATNAESTEDLHDLLDDAVKHLYQQGFDDPPSIPDVDEILGARYKTDNNHDAKEWHEIRRHLSGNRFCLTILLAAAQHLVEQSRNLCQGAVAAEALIKNTVNQVRNVGVHQKEDLVLSSVLECYRKFHVVGDPEADIDLHMLLMRHLGVIGTPTSVAVLVRLPEIRDYFSRLRQETDFVRSHTILAALTTLSERGLVFKLSPNPSMLGIERTGAPGWPFHLEFRYCLHRVVQRHTASLLGQGRVDPVRDNSFGPTLYGSMSSGGPRLSREAFVFLRRQMVSLSQYPDIPELERDAGPRPFAKAEVEVKTQALRAALSLARATFSVASISRFADYQRMIPGSEKRGYLETYRVRLRWIIRRAWELQQEVDPDGTGENRFFALYLDEIVWIYNELGVTALAQGNLTDALALLRQAAEFSSRIEGSPRTGPQGNVIGLNHAIVQLERGQLHSARTRLNLIEASSTQNKGTVHYMAKGYLCVLDHLTGRNQGLADRFEEVTDYFQKRGDKRAAAILLQHRARYLRLQDHKLSARLLQTARELSETGGHEDVRHHVQIAELLLAHDQPDASGIEQADKFRQLQEIERFGRRMGIWSLQCDALQLHARVLLDQGETSNAGHLLTRSLAIANRFSMTLRGNRALTLYADLLRRRGDLKGAEAIAISSLELAKVSNFSLETVRSQSVLALIHPGH